MAEDNDGIRLSRRKALAGLGSIGAATALGGVGTFAQLSDTEERAVTFTAGGLDGQISWSGSYNGDSVDDSLENVSVGSFDSYSNGITADVHFEDVKPGDFGCVNFSITVQNNPAWAASCVNVLEDIDYQNWEPEVKADDDVDEANYDGNGAFDPNSADGVEGDGELAENIFTIPYYDEDDTCTFFDTNGTVDITTLGYDGAVPMGFWANSQEEGEWGPDLNSGPISLAEDNTSSGDATGGSNEKFLAPRSLQDVSQNIRAVDTAHWSSDLDDTLEVQTAPDGATVDAGCVMLDGGLPDSQTDSNTQGVSPLHPGNTLNFGYDFHIPFGVGNVIQGDRLSLELGFVFLQTRHTEAPNFDDYAPGANTPN